MDNGSIFSSIADTLAGTLPNMLSALAILIIGWVIAVLLRSATLKLLGTRLLPRFESSAGRIQLDRRCTLFRWPRQPQRLDRER